jgi:hypothetical protein
MKAAKYFDAQLSDFKGPFYPIGIELLNQRWSLTNITSRILHAYAIQVKGFTRWSDPIQTSDGYTWFSGLYFKAGANAQVVIAFPHHHEGTLDRSVAVYVAGRVNSAEIERILSEMAKILLIEVTIIPPPNYNGCTDIAVNVIGVSMYGVGPKRIEFIIISDRGKESTGPFEIWIPCEVMVLNLELAGGNDRDLFQWVRLVDVETGKKYS